MPGMIANPEHQHPPELRCELESMIIAIVTAQDPESTALIGPLSAEPDKHSDDFVLRIWVGVAFVVMARGIAHHDDTRRVGTEIHVEFFLDQLPETRTEEVFHDRSESSTIPKIRQSVTAAIGNLRCVGKHLIL